MILQARLETAVGDLLVQLTPILVQALYAPDATAELSPSAVARIVCDLIADAKRQFKAPPCRPNNPDVPGEHYVMGENGEVLAAIWQPIGALWYCAEIAPTAISETEMGVKGYRWFREAGSAPDQAPPVHPHALNRQEQFQARP
jgi:hypothetical protein